MTGYSNLTPALANILMGRAESNGKHTQEWQWQEGAMHECVTEADWQACLDAFGERNVGNYIVDNCDSDGSDGMGSGCAYIAIEGTERVILASWNDQGFWDVTFASLEEADAAVDDYASMDIDNPDHNEDEDDEDVEVCACGFDEAQCGHKQEVGGCRQEN